MSDYVAYAALGLSVIVFIIIVIIVIIFSVGGFSTPLPPTPIIQPLDLQPQVTHIPTVTSVAMGTQTNIATLTTVSSGTYYIEGVVVIERTGNWQAAGTPIVGSIPSGAVGLEIQVTSGSTTTSRMLTELEHMTVSNNPGRWTLIVSTQIQLVGGDSVALHFINNTDNTITILEIDTGNNTPTFSFQLFKLKS